MAIKITQTCDGCSQEITQYQHSKCLALEQFTSGPTLSLQFQPWSEEKAKGHNMLHFHSDMCAKTYLQSWLLKQRTDASKWEAEAKEPAVVDAEFADVAPVTAQEMPAIPKEDIPF